MFSKECLLSLFGTCVPTEAGEAALSPAAVKHAVSLALSPLVQVSLLPQTCLVARRFPGENVEKAGMFAL